MSAPVVIVEKGGVPVTNVPDAAPLMVAENGFGVAVTLVENGTPVTISGLPEPEPEEE